MEANSRVSVTGLKHGMQFNFKLHVTCALDARLLEMVRRNGSSMGYVLKARDESLQQLQ